MQHGEVVVARLSGGMTIGRCLPPTRRASRVRISIGRNREAQVPADRVIMATGVTASSNEEVEEFRKRCEDLASGIDLAEVWEVVRDEMAAMALDDLAELYWGAPPDVAQRVALLLHLGRASLYFVQGDEGYAARSEESVAEIRARRTREAENATAAASLIEHLSQGALPPEMTGYQSTLVQHLRGYAIHGESYTRSGDARGLLESVGGGRDLQRLSLELLERVGVFSPDEPLELERAGISEQFPEAVLTEADAIDLSPALEDPSRSDLTALPTVTIDDADAEDRDDALSLVADARPGGPEATYRIGVHVADAAALIPHGGAIDREADRRMATLYMPDRKVTMLPPQVSGHLGSLVPGERRVALSLLAWVDESGEVLEWEVASSVIRSQAALSYEEANLAIGDAGHPWHELLAPLSRIAQSLRRRRERAGAVSLDRPEMLIDVRPSGAVDVRVVPRSSPARLMVAEFMILCNSLLAEFCRREGIPAPYRFQAATDLSDVVDDTTEGPLRWHLVMRRLLPAEIDTVPQAHGGLGVSAYIQATSPLRRYPDLVAQRQISHYLTSRQTVYSTEAIASLAQRAEVEMRELDRLEEERKRYWFLKYLKQTLLDPEGEEGLLQAVVLENRPGRPALLELADYPFRVRAELPGSSAPGDTVTLRLHGVDLWRRVGHFVHVAPAE